ncbi:unnamed protein product [Vitrella brassicaformis CCMP3155]|uniref:TLDc domain-containing protein n=1 Tax=Vitrella brassicaformis (strain CCMP3155) TaxID=1169540 RepID=A0A0G4EU68_VITBC|nr:unnamed protein product [Vitrella brassicaformis CCMP3155]|eukprot:CEM01630.1 unnamed protein product [Vitrella brassicaformis CCMP3155]
MADHLIRRSSESFMAAKERADAEMQAIANEISTLVAAEGGTWQLTDTEGEIMVNAGGSVFPVSRRVLLMPYMKHRYISVLLMHHASGLPRDADGHIYLETSPAYFEAFLDELTLYETGRTNTVELPPPKAADPLYADYHALFTREINCYAAPQQTTPPHTASTASTDNPTGSEDQAIQQYLKACEQFLRTHSAAIKQLQGVRDDIRCFLEAMEPFFASPDGSENEILSLTVLGRKVSMMRKTFSRLGPNHPLLTRFATTPPCWADRRVRQTPTKCFVTTVEFARRIAVLPACQLIRPPLLEEGGERHFIDDIEMYGLRYQPYCHLPAADGTDFIAKSAEEWGKVIDMTGKPSPRATLIYKSSRDTFEYPSFLNKVVGKSGLLFAIRQGDTHRFGAFVDGPLTAPQDPTKTNRYKAPLFFFSLSGAYETPTKIELPEERQ